MNVKPLADRVLVLPAQAEEKVGGIIIPDTAKRNLSTARWLPLVTALRMRRWSLKRVTKSSMASILVQSLSSTAQSTS